MVTRVLAAGVVAVMWVAIHIMDWMDPEDYDEEAEEADWPPPPDMPEGNDDE